MINEFVWFLTGLFMGLITGVILTILLNKKEK